MFCIKSTNNNNNKTSGFIKCQQIEINFHNWIPCVENLRLLKVKMIPSTSNKILKF